MSTRTTQSIEMPGGFAPNPVMRAGDGPPLVFLHGMFGPEWGAFQDGLSASRTVYAPLHAGGTDLADLEQMDGLWDLLLYYDDLFAALGLDRFDLVGHSFGGMVAAEYAATYPGRVGKLVLIDALGLWDPELPVADHLLALPTEQAALRFHDPEAPAIAELLRMPEDRDRADAAMVASYLALSSTAHFIHPIPERGLHRRLRRIAAPTLVLWGAHDTLTPPAYANAFVEAIADATLTTIAGAGHTPQVERPDAALDEVTRFLR